MKKIKSYFINVNEQIEGIKEWKWFLFCFFICLFLKILISPEILWQPYIFAEDAGVYFTDAMNEGIQSLWLTFGGYISLIPRLISLIALFLGEKYNSIVLVTYTMKWLAIAFTTICISYFNANQFKWIIKERLLRLIIAILMMFSMANQSFMLYNATYTHWWGGLLVFLVGINLLHKKIPPMYIIPILILAILSSPSAVLIAIPICYYMLSEMKQNFRKTSIKNYVLNHKLDILKLILIAVALIIEVFSIVFLQNEVDVVNKQIISLEFLINLAVNIFKTVANITTYSLTFGFGEKLPNIVSLIIGAVIWVALIFVYFKNKNLKILIWSILEIVGLYFLAEYKNSDLYKLPYYWANWYNSIPATIVMFLISNCLLYYVHFNNKIIKCICFLCVITLLIFGFKYAKRPEYSYCANIFDIESEIDFNSNKKTKIQNAGGEVGAFELPIKDYGD